MDNKSRKLSKRKNDGQNECEETETSALKQKLVHMEAELKQRNAEKEGLVQRIASLEQDLAKKEAQLNLRNAENEDLVQRVSSLEQDLATKEAELNQHNSEKEELDQRVTALEQDLEEKQNYLSVMAQLMNVAGALGSDASSSDDESNSDDDWMTLSVDSDDESGVSISDDDMEPAIVEELSEAVLTLKNEGNALYSAKDFSGAVQKYSECLKLCIDKDTDRSTLLKNRAAAYLSLQEYEKVVEDTTAALEITPNDVKALYRRCQAYEQLTKYNEAFEDAKAVYRLDPKNSAIQPYLKRLEEMKPEESNETVLALKDEGNTLYSAGDFSAAVKKYSECLKLCTDNSIVRSTLLKNRAAAYLSLREHQKAVEDATAALQITPSDIKALYRRCQAYEQLGKYNDAFADAKAVNHLNPKNSAIQPYLKRLQEIVNEKNEDAVGINSLPNEILLEIFGHLNQNQLGQISRLCRRWNELTKDPVFWKEVDVKFSPVHRSQTTVAKCFINRLPSSVTSIKLDFMEYKNWTGALDYVGLCAKLKEKCPNIKVLIVTDSALSDSIPSVVDICSEYLPDVKSLGFHRCVFPCYPPRKIVEFKGASKIEVLDLSWSTLGGFTKPHFSKMPSLKVLCLHDTNVNVSMFHGDLSFLDQFHVLDLGLTGIDAAIFQAIEHHGLNLKELYLCSLDLQEHDSTFKDSKLPHLKTICMSNTSVKSNVVVSLIRSCPSLENVYVDNGLAKSVAKHSFVVANRHVTEIVKVISPWDHNHDVDYSRD